jgi:hypothetical protein
VYTPNHDSRIQKPKGAWLFSIQKSYPMQSSSLPTCPMVEILPKPLNEEKVNALLVGRF